MNYFSSRFQALSIAPSWGSVRQYFIYISPVTQLSFNVNRDSVNCSQRIARANASVGKTRAWRNASATMTRNNRGVFLISIAATRFISRRASAYPKHTRERSVKITSTSFSRGHRRASKIEIAFSSSCAFFLYF